MHVTTQNPAIRTVFEKGLVALSVEEVGHLLSHLGLARFVTDFKQQSVRLLFCVRFFL